MTNNPLEVVSVIGRRVRTPSGRIGVLERISLDYTKTKMTYHVRCGRQSLVLPASKVEWV